MKKQTKLIEKVSLLRDFEFMYISPKYRTEDQIEYKDFIFDLMASIVTACNKSNLN